MSVVRTTLTLDDDVAEKLRRLAQQRRVPFKRVVNELLRRALSGQDRRRRTEPFRMDTFRSAFRAGVDPGKLNQLSDELEAQRAREKLGR
jgi:hypothetical protein